MFSLFIPNFLYRAHGHTLTAVLNRQAVSLVYALLHVRLGRVEEFPLYIFFFDYLACSLQGEVTPFAMGDTTALGLFFTLFGLASHTPEEQDIMDIIVENEKVSLISDSSAIDLQS